MQVRLIAVHVCMQMICAKTGLSFRKKTWYSWQVSGRMKSERREKRKGRNKFPDSAKCRSREFLTTVCLLTLKTDYINIIQINYT